MSRIEAFEAALRAASLVKHPLEHARAVSEAYRSFLPIIADRPKYNPQTRRKKVLTQRQA